MRVCQSEANLPAALQAARNEAEAAFKNPSVYLEKFIDRPRHVEVQLLADTLGNVVHCWERDCSRRSRTRRVPGRRLRSPRSPTTAARESVSPATGLRSTSSAG